MTGPRSTQQASHYGGKQDTLHNYLWQEQQQLDLLSQTVLELIATPPTQPPLEKPAAARHLAAIASLTSRLSARASHRRFGGMPEFHSGLRTLLR